MIKYLKHHEIDYKRWDETLTKSHNKMPYALTWYLDAVSPGWEALIEGDYEFIMPLTVKKKYGIPYITKPLFSQQLGVFSEKPISNQKISEFINQIPKKFIIKYINFNYNNLINSSKAIQKPNFELNLNTNYTNIYKNFNNNTKRNCKKAESSGLIIETGMPEDFIFFYKKHNFGLNLKFIPIAEQLIKKAFQNNSGKIYLLKNTQNICVGGAFFICSLERLIYLMPFSTEEGKDNSAMFLLIDYIINTNAQSNLILDFEGSELPGVSKFIKGFGSKLIQYSIIRQHIFSVKS
jgi:hypothetical protein